MSLTPSLRPDQRRCSVVASAVYPRDNHEKAVSGTFCFIFVARFHRAHALCETSNSYCTTVDVGLTTAGRTGHHDGTPGATGRTGTVVTQAARAGLLVPTAGLQWRRRRRPYGHALKTSLNCKLLLGYLH